MTHDENIAKQFVCPHANVTARLGATLAAKRLNKCCESPPQPLKKMTVDEESFDYTHYEEGGANEIAGGFELLHEAQHYQNLRTTLYERPDGIANGCAHAHTLVELRAACVGDFDMQMSDEQMAFFARVHTELDWDERRELIDALNDLERLDVDGVASDCFTYHKKLWRRDGQTVLRLIYHLCCTDGEFQTQSHRYSLFCLCDTPNKCVNPQHYIHRVAHAGPRMTIKRRQRCFASSSTTTTTVSSGSADIIEQTRAELTHAKDGAERQRLLAMLACLTDHLALDGDDANVASCIDFENDVDDDRSSSASSFDQQHTPPMTSNTSGTATPIGSNAKRKATDLIVIGGKRKRASTPSPPPAPVFSHALPPAQTCVAACKPMAIAYNARMTDWHRLVEIL